MKIIITCSSEDIELINAVNRDFNSSEPIETYSISGITGADTIMMILTGASAFGSIVVPFIIMYMTKNKDDEIKSKRTISIEREDESVFKLECEGFSEDAIRELVKEALNEK